MVELAAWFTEIIFHIDDDQSRPSGSNESFLYFFGVFMRKLLSVGLFRLLRG